MSTASSIRVQTSLLVPGYWNHDVPLTPERATIGRLLDELGRSAGLAMVDAQGELIDFLDVKLNGKDVNFLPARLATPLADRDRVAITLVPIGGG